MTKGMTLGLGMILFLGTMSFLASISFVSADPAQDTKELLGGGHPIIGAKCETERSRIWKSYSFRYGARYETVIFRTYTVTIDGHPAHLHFNPTGKLRERLDKLVEIFSKVEALECPDNGDIDLLE